MKTTRLVIGIVSIVLSVIVSLQSCAVGVGEAILDSEEVGGAGGMLLGFAFLVGGILAVVGKKSKATSIVAGVFYLLGALLGFVTAGSFSDLKIWSGLALIFAAVLLLTGILQKKENKKEE